MRVASLGSTGWQSKFKNVEFEFSSRACIFVKNQCFFRVYLNGKLIGEASALTPSITIEFPILTDSILDIQDEGENSIMKVNSFEMTSCNIDPNGNYF